MAINSSTLQTITHKHRHLAPTHTQIEQHKTTDTYRNTQLQAADSQSHRFGGAGDSRNTGVRSPNPPEPQPPRYSNGHFSYLSLYKCLKAVSK